MFKNKPLHKALSEIWTRIRSRPDGATVSRAYRKHLGCAGRRSDSQQIVLDSLAHQCRMHTPVFKAGKFTGADPIAAAHADGMRAAFIYILEQCEKGRAFDNPEDNQKPKITT